MSVAVIRFELWRMAAQAEEHVREASELLEHGTETQKIKAASQIAFFRTEKADFESRLRQLEDCPENLIAKVRILRTARPKAQSLPRSALLTDETESNFWVMKLIDSATAVKVPVMKGIETADRVEVLSPIFDPDDKILITGNYGLPDTAKVKVETQTKVAATDN